MLNNSTFIIQPVGAALITHIRMLPAKCNQSRLDKQILPWRLGPCHKNEIGSYRLALFATWDTEMKRDETFLQKFKGRS